MRVVGVHFVSGIKKKMTRVQFPEIVGWFVFCTAVPPEVLLSNTLSNPKINLLQRVGGCWTHWTITPPFSGISSGFQKHKLF
jgi:hypothetical protein